MICAKKFPSLGQPCAEYTVSNGSLKTMINNSDTGYQHNEILQVIGEITKAYNKQS